MLSKPCKDRPELAELLARAKESFNALTPEQKREHRRAQAKSWVIGNMMLDHPDLSRDEAERIYNEMSL